MVDAEVVANPAQLLRELSFVGDRQLDDHRVDRFISVADDGGLEIGDVGIEVGEARGDTGNDAGTIRAVHAQQVGGIGDGALAVDAGDRDRQTEPAGGVEQRVPKHVGLVVGSDEQDDGEVSTEDGHRRVLEVATALLQDLGDRGDDAGLVGTDSGNSELGQRVASLRSAHVTVGVVQLRPRIRPHIHLGVLVAACLVVVVALSGCDGPAGSEGSGQVPSTEDPAPETEEQQGAGQDLEADGEARSDTTGEGPSVPPLHAEIDDLPESVVTITTDDGSVVRIDVKVATTTEQRRRGLMEVPDLPEGTGMLFLFEEERSGGFWMWNTLVPLDIAYIAADGTIVDILAMDPCEEDEAAACPTYEPDQAYVAAVEVPQDWFAWQGVSSGDHVRWTDPAS